MSSTRLTEAEIERALVQTVRANNAAFDATVSGMGIHSGWNNIHEGVAPPDTEYPFTTYQLVAAPYEDDWSKRTIRAAFDVSVWSDNQVEARTLDRLTMQTLEDNSASVSGQTTLYIRRVEGLRLPETDETGRRIFRSGGTYVWWADQPL